jgi:hypothetical protein
MACGVVRPVEIEVSLDTKNQTRENVIAIVERILNANGAIECGLMGHFTVALGASSERPPAGGDPGPELKKLGVTSLKKTETR